MAQLDEADLGSLPAAWRLSGMTLPNGWRVLHRIELHEAATGGTFSCGYHVESPEGRQAFLKAMDYSEALNAEDPARALEAMTRAYNFERDLLRRCRERHLSRVVLALESGSIRVEGAYPSPVVQYLLLELADGDVRRFMEFGQRLDVAWILRSLHQLATGIQQLHGIGIAHQDMKPSNALVFAGRSSKVSDLGRATHNGQEGPFDELLVAGDVGYAPPELLYGQVEQDWDSRRLGCDLYLLGSMVAFFFTGLSMTSMWLSKLAPTMHWSCWSGTYSDILPYVRHAFREALEDLGAHVPADSRADLVEIVGQLCDPEPMRRGHPRNRLGHSNPLSLERYVTRFNLLAKRAELGLIGK